VLLNAAERGGMVMLAEMAMRRAFNADGEPPKPELRGKRAKA
jgi:hypothetical protein